MCEDIITPTILRNLYYLVKNYVLSHYGSPDDVEDTLQEGLYRFLTSYKKNGFQQSKNPENYIFSICKNVWLKEVDKKQKAKRVAGFIVEELEDDCWAMKDKHRKEALLEILENNLPLLSSKCQKVLDFRKEGLTCDEIAVLLGLKSGQIAKDKHYRCKERLRALIKQDKAYQALFKDD